MLRSWCLFACWSSCLQALRTTLSLAEQLRLVVDSRELCSASVATQDFTRAQRNIHRMVSITWHTRNTWEYTGKKGGFGRKGYVACTGGYECIMHA